MFRSETGWLADIEEVIKMESIYMLTANEAREISNKFHEARLIANKCIRESIFKGKNTTNVEVNTEMISALTDVLGELGYEWDIKWSADEVNGLVTIKW